MKRIRADRDYKEHYEQVDLQTLEKKIEEKLVPKEGDEPLDDDAK